MPCFWWGIRSSALYFSPSWQLKTRNSFAFRSRRIRFCLFARCKCPLGKLSLGIWSSLLKFLQDHTHLRAITKKINIFVNVVMEVRGKMICQQRSWNILSHRTENHATRLDHCDQRWWYVWHHEVTIWDEYIYWRYIHVCTLEKRSVNTECDCIALIYFSW